MQKVNCPTCKQVVTWSVQNVYRPFCSERCRLLDQGNWASGAYSIPAQNQQQDHSNLTSTDVISTD